MVILQQIDLFLVIKRENLQKVTRKELSDFYTRYSRRLFNTSLRIVGNSQDAEEIMHDTLLKFLLRENDLLSILNDYQVSAWLTKTCARASIDLIRSRKQLVEQETELLGDNIIDNQQESAQQRELIEYKAQQIADSISQLDQPYKTILTLVLIEGFDYSEVSQITGSKETTIRSQFSRGKEKIRNILHYDNRR